MELTCLAREMGVDGGAGPVRAHGAPHWCRPCLRDPLALVMPTASDRGGANGPFPAGAALARERDMQYVQRMKSKWLLKTGMQNNATKQMHFRPQVRF